MDELFRQHCREVERSEFAGVFRALRRAFGPKPRLVLAKSFLAKSLLTKPLKPKATKPAKPAPLVVVSKPQLSDRELAVFLGDATVRGLLTGSLALQVQKDVDAGRKMPADVRAILLAAYGGKSGK